MQHILSFCHMMRHIVELMLGLSKHYQFRLHQNQYVARLWSTSFLKLKNIWAVCLKSLPWGALMQNHVWAICTDAEMYFSVEHWFLLISETLCPVSTKNPLNSIKSIISLVYWTFRVFLLSTSNSRSIECQVVQNGIQNIWRGSAAFVVKNHDVAMYSKDFTYFVSMAELLME